MLIKHKKIHAPSLPPCGIDEHQHRRLQDRDPLRHPTPSRHPQNLVAEVVMSALRGGALVREGGAVSIFLLTGYSGCLGGTSVSQSNTHPALPRLCLCSFTSPVSRLELYTGGEGRRQLLGLFRRCPRLALALWLHTTSPSRLLAPDLKRPVSIGWRSDPLFPLSLLRGTRYCSTAPKLVARQLHPPLLEAGAGSSREAGWVRCACDRGGN